MEGDLESESTLSNPGVTTDDSYLDISVATLTWMLQCIAPHLDIDLDAFNKLNMQYRLWLTKIRYACTYHHPENEGWGEWLWNKVPDVPFLGEEPDPLKPPRRSALQ
jgi:hypothetical protein